MWKTVKKDINLWKKNCFSSQRVSGQKGCFFWGAKYAKTPKFFLPGSEKIQENRIFLKQKFLSESSPRREGCNIDNPAKQVREMTEILGSNSKDSYEPKSLLGKKFDKFFFWTYRRLLLITFRKISIKSRKLLAWSRRKLIKRTLYSSRVFLATNFLWTNKMLFW